jgi:putative membrane protein
MICSFLNTKEFVQSEERKVRLILVIFYSVGILGFIFPATRALFLKLTPLAILLSFSVIILFHKMLFDRKTMTAFFSVFIGTWGIEAIGVATGMIFGSYSYGSGLGIKILNTPILIGLNWLFLAYSTSSITEELKITPFLRVLIASLLMVLYDFIIENVARDLEMWSFKDGMPPVKNYVSWFLIAVFIHSAFRLAGIKTINRIAPFIFILQSLFFILLIFLFRISE